MVLERVDSVDPVETYDYIICGYLTFTIFTLCFFTNKSPAVAHQAV
jgi:hypothetical protein